MPLYTFVCIHRLYHIKREPERKRWTSDDGDVGGKVGRFLKSNKCTVLVGDADGGRGSAGVEQRGHGKYLYFPLNFAVDIKLI